MMLYCNKKNTLRDAGLFKLKGRVFEKLLFNFFFFNCPCRGAAAWPLGPARGRLLRSHISWLITTGLKQEFIKKVEIIGALLLDVLRTNSTKKITLKC